jgi:murein DD-endopeptidase MepM/ murein hydrolase activator NlpD
MSINNDVNIQELITEVAGLFNNKESFNQYNNDLMLNQNVPQIPIKGSVKCSGVFGSGDARHNGIHNGVDLRAPGGTSIYPMLPGIVSNVSYSSKGGNNVSIMHDNGIATYYAHMGSVTVNKGDKVYNNTVIGTVGDSGNAKGTMPHLHFEVSHNKTKENPAKYFKVPPYTKPDKNEKYWLSDEYKNTARSFNMNQHIKTHKTAFTLNVNKLIKIAFKFSKYSGWCNGSYGA